MPGSPQSSSFRPNAPGGDARDAVQRAIVEGDLPAGAFLDEDALASSLTVSRADVRAALHGLVAIDLVRDGPGPGHRVTPFEPIRLAQMVQVAAALSGTAARLALPNLTPDDLAWLEQAEGHLFAFDAPVSGAHPYGPFEVDVFLARSGNDVLRAAMDPLQPHMLRLVRRFGRRLTQTAMAGRTGGAMAALRAGDAHLLGESVRVFYEHVGMELVGAVESMGADDTRA